MKFRTHNVTVTIGGQAFRGFSSVSFGPTKSSCTCVPLDGGAVLSDGCAVHTATSARTVTTIEAKEMRP